MTKCHWIIILAFSHRIIYMCSWWVVCQQPQWLILIKKSLYFILHILYTSCKCRHRGRGRPHSCPICSNDLAVVSRLINLIRVGKSLDSVQKGGEKGGGGHSRLKVRSRKSGGRGESKSLRRLSQDFYRSKLNDPFHKMSKLAETSRKPG